MKTLSAFLFSALIAGKALAYNFPDTITTAGAIWSPSDTVTAIVPTQGNPGPGGFGLSEGEFANLASGRDAYDGAFGMRINTTAFASSINGATLSSAAYGMVLNSSVANYGVDAQVQFTFFNNLPIVRALYSFTNTGAAATLNMKWEMNLGSDAATKIERTSTGGAALTAADRWVVSSDAGAGDLVNTLVRYGPNAPHTPDSSPYLLAGGSNDLLSDQYNLSFGAAGTSNSVMRLMMFGVLTSVSGGQAAGVQSAINFASVFNDYSAMTANHLFDGLPSDTQNIVNWGIVPEPSSSLLLLTGLFALRLLHPKRK
jgi:hypothetical protein